MMIIVFFVEFNKRKRNNLSSFLDNSFQIDHYNHPLLIRGSSFEFDDTVNLFFNINRSNEEKFSRKSDLMKRGSM